jgi:hypothetical protein
MRFHVLQYIGNVPFEQKRSKLSQQLWELLTNPLAGILHLSENFIKSASRDDKLSNYHLFMFEDDVPRSLVEINRRLGGVYYIHYQGDNRMTVEFTNFATLHLSP